ncbi:MAG: glutamate--tRNA ligase [Lentisphaeria bacterium]|nr:glutamate--tRNA ligase [Lentisphaeria bacterium]
MGVRVRFAPSPTGHVHIGNIRAALFNWLFARHEGGQFLLRVEDTDRERSTPEAIATLLDVMQWLGLAYDEEPLFQTSQEPSHCRAAARLLEENRAYRSAKDGEGEAIVFRIPWEAEQVPGVEVCGSAELAVHPDEPVEVRAEGLGYAGVSKKGKAVTGGVSCLAGFRDLEVSDGGGRCLLVLADVLDRVFAGDSLRVPGAVCLRFTRRAIAFTDLVKGRLSKPLDSMRDFVIVRSDGHPVFHLGNVCDDVTQGITHIIRGDDHVENTYRHLFLFHALGAEPPRYAHLPMIVNAAGKPYSKRDGDAFVGDFRDKGYLPEALFNYLALLGWNPGDAREKMDRAELVRAFALDRVQQSPARMDPRKLLNLNGQYMAEMDPGAFRAGARAVAASAPWGDRIDEALFGRVAALMQTRTKVYTDALGWGYFFVDTPEYDPKAVRSLLCRTGVAGALSALLESLCRVDFADVGALEQAVQAAAGAAGLEPGSLNQPLRAAVTGCTVGAGVFETLAVLGRKRTLARIPHALRLAGLVPATGEG